MGDIRPPIAVKLFTGMLSSEPSLFDACGEILRATYGPIGYESALLPWDKSSYYADEMGPGLFRKFLYFQKLFDPGELAAMKNFTNALEGRLAGTTSHGVFRRVNIDPGYITEAKVVLATTKDFPHRVYIGSGVYAEATLRYSGKDRSFVAFEHTYFDYRTETYLTLFNKARELLRTELNR